MDDLKRIIEGLQQQITDSQTTTQAWRKEDVAAAATITSGVTSLATTVEGLAARIVKLEGLASLPDTDASQSSAAPHKGVPKPPNPPNLTAPPPNPSGKPLLAGKGVLDNDGVLQHGPELLPKKPFEEVIILKTAHASSSGSGSSTDVMVPRYFKLDFPRYDGKEDPLPWLSRCEQFFRAQRTEPQQQI
jgi:hypothetical protein